MLHMIFDIIGSIIIVLYVYTQIKWIVWLFNKKPIAFNKLFIISLLTTTIGAYIILMLIVNKNPSEQYSVTYLFSQSMDIALYGYLTVMLIMTIVEIIKIIHIDDETLKQFAYKQFMKFSFVKIISIVMFMGYIVLLTI